MGTNYEITPMADYILHGLVVSMNNPKALGDSYHDETSFDTKDLCVIWGDNLDSNKFHKVKFWSGSWTCNWKYKGGVDWDNHKVANNHLITEDAIIRTRLDGIKAGDQITIKGKLVNYKNMTTGFDRKSSLSRTDNDGKSGCEVVLVEELIEIKSSSRIFNKIFKYSWLFLIGLIMFYFLGPMTKRR